MDLLNEFKPISGIATTRETAKTLQPLCQNIGATLWLPESLNSLEEGQFYKSDLKTHLAKIWKENKALIFCLAAGAVVRLISPLLADKKIDPAVIVIDPKGKFVISLCGGHIGGGDRLTKIVANLIGATPIITGIANSLNLPGIDVLGFPFGWKRGQGDWNRVAAVIAKLKTVQVVQEVGSTLWQENLPAKHPFYFGFVEDNKISISPQARVWISFTKRRFSPDSDLPKVQWHPRVLWVGIGCERGTSKQLIKQAIETVFDRNHLATEAIAGIATIDIKADELGILELSRDWQLPIITFTAAELAKIEVPTPSKVVSQEVGTPSVAEAAAILAAKNPLLVSKQIFKQEGEKGAVTVAIAVAEKEYLDRKGSLSLVGIGPGSLDQITPAAKTAITTADVVVGYSLYLDLVSSLFYPGQIIESSNITQERDRACRAIELAQWGLNVAVISSGDCGIYGMAGLVLEECRSQNWDGNNPKVEVFPGITAMQAAASRVGTPLMHDFCAISLSDLLTPWPVIAKRLEAAAIADFVTALYNPRSLKRTEQIKIARDTFLKHRDPNTPVAIVRSAYRLDEQIYLTTLEEMLEVPIDMLSTVIIGNSSTRNYANLMITPRGYFNVES
ncbi:MAG: precorrin-3B C(17)-methyltransferase [Prochloraceae cyanobacterium]|nr:precorrin-3B C(17)-methyltransferase [Prochloraceae cyanobacterium]